MGKYLKTGTGIKVRTQWGEEGELCATYQHPSVDGGIRNFRVRLGPALFIDLPRNEFEYTEPVINFKAIKKLFDTSIW